VGREEDAGFGGDMGLEPRYIRGERWEEAWLGGWEEVELKEGVCGSGERPVLDQAG
jgi:hypothetical protein